MEYIFSEASDSALCSGLNYTNCSQEIAESAMSEASHKLQFHCDELQGILLDKPYCTSFCTPESLPVYAPLAIVDCKSNCSGFCESRSTAF